MTDMRATERLLEVIEEQVPMIEHVAFDHDPMLVPKLEPCLTAIRFMLLELRGRGDTLVRRHDLAYCLEHTFDVSGDMDVYHEHRARLENALGGKP